MKWTGWLFAVVLLASRPAFAGVNIVMDAAQAEYPNGAVTAPLVAGDSWTKTFVLFAPGVDIPTNCAIWNVGALPHDWTQGSQLQCQMNLVDLLGTSTNPVIFRLEPFIIPTGQPFPNDFPVPAVFSQTFIMPPGNHNFFPGPAPSPIFYMDPLAVNGNSPCGAGDPCNDGNMAVRVCRTGTSGDTNPDVIALASISCH